MAKPSVFSKNYHQQMKRRKLNVVLLVLIIISMAFYGGRYYLKKKNIKLFDYKKFQVQNTVQKNKDVNKKIYQKLSPKENKLPKENPTVNKQEQFYVYKRKDAKEIKINYIVNGELKEITSITDLSNLVVYDISTDKQRIVFDDNSAATIIVADVNGTFNTISKEKYVSKSSGDVYLKENVISRNPWFVWAAKPHFTSEGNVVYFSNLPYIKENSNLYLWVVKPDGTGHKKITKLDKDISKITYGSFDKNGELSITSGDNTYFISKDGYDYSN